MNPSVDMCKLTLRPLTTFSLNIIRPRSHYDKIGDNDKIYVDLCPLYSLSCHCLIEVVVAALEPKITTATAVMTATKVVIEPKVHARIPS